ncbi:MAG: hypothetical protein H0W64_11675 [Gammaproteobacteria bacterium]|nr:hypothetical protein [Gammaproteobacteria bacterium]
MDVGNPSNFERLHYLFNYFKTFKNEVKAIRASDDDIKNTVKTIYKKHKMIVCPHTATAFYARQHLSKQPWIVVATADPSKCDTVIEDMIHTPIPVPPQLQMMLETQAQNVTSVTTLEDIRKIIIFKNMHAD